MDNDLLMMDDEDKSKFTTSHSPLKKGYMQTEMGEIPEDWKMIKNTTFKINTFIINIINKIKF